MLLHGGGHNCGLSLLRQKSVEIGVNLKDVWVSTSLRIPTLVVRRTRISERPVAGIATGATGTVHSSTDGSTESMYYTVTCHWQTGHWQFSERHY